MTFATLASLLAFTLEWILHKAFHRKLKVLHAPNGELRDPQDSVAGLPVSVKETNDILPVTTPEQRMRLKALHNMVVSYTFEIGIIFHSEYLCKTLGWNLYVHRSDYTVCLVMLLTFLVTILCVT